MVLPLKSLRELIETRTGIECPSSNPSLEAFVLGRADHHKLSGPEAYTKLMEARPRQDREWVLLLDEVTNGLTHFFRDLEQFDVLGHVLTEIHRAEAVEKFFLWSAGCATGEEPYSLAIFCHRLGLPVQVLGSDVNAVALEKATKGVYGGWALRHVGKDFIDRYFEVVHDPSTTQKMYRVRDEVREHVRLERVNLVLDRAPSPNGTPRGFHAVFCRNVLIYYSRDVIARIARKLISSLSREGALFLGASESLRGLDVTWFDETVMGRAVVRRPDVTVRDRGAPSTLPRPVSRKAKPALAPAARLSPAAAPNGASLRAAGSALAPATKAPPPAPPAPTSADVPAATGPEALGSYLQVRDSVVASISDDKLGEAEATLQEVVKTSEGDILAWLSLGHLALAAHRFDEAVACYERAAALDPLLAEVHFFRGLVAHKRSEFKTALDHFQKSLFLEPDFWAASFLLGSAARRLGQEGVWRREYQRTGELVRSRRGTLPMVSHPVFHSRFVPSAEGVLQLCDQVQG